MENSRKKELICVILFVLMLITLVVGVTYTYYTLLVSDKEDSTQIKTGDISIKYIGGKDINASGLIPIYEPTIDDEEYVYKKKFSVKSDGSLDQNLDIYINVTDNQFTYGSLKYALYDSNNRKVSIGNVPSNGKALIKTGDYLESGKTNDYTVLIWLQENDTNQNNEQGSKFVGGFEIIAKQVELK